MRNGFPICSHFLTSCTVQIFFNVFVSFFLQLASEFLLEEVNSQQKKKKKKCAGRVSHKECGEREGVGKEFLFEYKIKKLCLLEEEDENHHRSTRVTSSPSIAAPFLLVQRLRFDIS